MGPKQRLRPVLGRVIGGLLLGLLANGRIGAAENSAHCHTGPVDDHPQPAYFSYTAGAFASLLIVSGISAVRRRMRANGGTGHETAVWHWPERRRQRPEPRPGPPERSACDTRQLELTATIAHELGQPLSAMRAYIATLLMRLPPEQGDLAPIVRALQEQTQRACEIVSRLRLLAEGGRPQLAEIDLDALIQGAISLVRVHAICKAVAIYFQPAAGLRRVRADPVLIEGVLRNLLENAIKAMATQPPERERALIITIEGSESCFEVVVSDSGPGLPPGGEETLFEPFVSGREGGLGMGLAICRQVIEAHGGTIRASQLPGGGAQFRFTLPRILE